MATHLVTGVAGFIGCHIARALLQRGHRVRGIDDLSTGRRENIADIEADIELRLGSILDEEAMAEACRGVDCVFHEAAINSVPRSIDHPVRSVSVNVMGTLQVLVAARGAGVRRVIYAASSSEYGETATLPKVESMPPNPSSPYAISKLAGELFTQSFYRVYGLETVALRYFNVFGPRQHPTSPYAAVFAKFIHAMLDGRAPTIYGDGEQSRDFTYIDNVVHANLLACEAPAERVAGQVFNIAAGRRITLNHAVRLLQQLTGLDVEPIHAPDRAGDVRHSLADTRRAREAFGYSVQVEFEEGLRRTVEWYRQAREGGESGAADGARAAELAKPNVVNSR